VKDLVECRSSESYPGRPLALHWLGQRLDVTRIPVDWRTPGARHFRVETEDGQCFDLTYNEVKDEWTIEQP
jgi:uncharacterized protein YndB with AHSA1/START domain